jgi:heptosyltransferase-1
MSAISKAIASSFQTVGQNQVNSIKTTKTILLLPMCGLGDAVCYLPFMRAIRSQFPAAKILVVVATGAAQTLIRGSLREVEVVVFNRRRQGWLGLLRLLRSVRRRKFEIVISGAHPDSIRIPLFASLCGAAIRVGAKSERLSFLYNRTVDVATDAHAFERYRQLLTAIDIQISPGEYRPTLEPSLDTKDLAMKVWTDAGLDHVERVVGMVSGADLNVRGSWIPSLKRWNIEGYAEVVRWATKAAHARVVFFGAPEEATLVAAIARSSGVSIVNLCGKTRIEELQWLLKKCTVFVSNDTGAMHIAAAVGTPVVALFGPTSPESFGPLGDQHRTLQGRAPCSPCYPRPSCNLESCLAMESISAQQVIKSLNSILAARTCGIVTAVHLSNPSLLPTETV